MLDFDSGFSLGDTLDAGMSLDIIGGNTGPVSEAVIDTPKSDGITFGGIFDTIEKTANTGFNLFSKAYTLYNTVEANKVNMALNQNRIDLAKAQASGQIDVDLAKTQAAVAIAKMQAGAAVANAQRQVESSAQAGYVNGTKTKWADLLPFFVIGGIIWKLAGGKKA